MPRQQQIKWQPSISREQADSIPRNTWERYREVIREKYDRMVLSDLKNEMQAEFGFVATFVHPNSTYCECEAKRNSRMMQRITIPSPV
jgi:Clr5 domain